MKALDFGIRLWVSSHQDIEHTWKKQISGFGQYKNQLDMKLKKIFFFLLLRMCFCGFVESF